MVHPKYAFGKINAEKLVTAAKTWVNVGPQLKYTPSPVFPDAKIPYTTVSIQGYIGAVTIDSGQTDITALEHVQVSVSLTSSFRGGLVFELKCPSGTDSVLLTARPYDSASGAMSWTFMTTRCWDESPIGTWHLFVYATNQATNGFLKAWSLTVYGSNKSGTKSCKTSEYLDANDNCSPCDSACGDEGCIGQGPALCRNCLNFKVNGICFNDCPDGHYPSSVIAGQCEICSNECATCTGPGSNQCLTCPLSKEYDAQQQACICQLHTYEDHSGVCQHCNPECSRNASCTGPDSNQCTGSCAHVQFGVDCVPECPPLTYASTNLTYENMNYSIKLCIIKTFQHV